MQKTKAKRLNHSYSNFQIFNIQSLILVHLFFVFAFAEQSISYFLSTLSFCKEGQRNDKLDAICKDKEYALRRARYHKNYF